MVEEPPKYCVCKKSDVRGKKYSNEMIQCDQCWEWFHYDCVGIPSGAELGDDEWKCEWCLDPLDKEAISGGERDGRGQASDTTVTSHDTTVLPWVRTSRQRRRTREIGTGRSTKCARRQDAQPSKNES